MMNRYLTIAVAAMTVGGAAAAQESPVLVSTLWLSHTMEDPNLRILHVGMSHRGLPEEVIPGATFVDYHGFALSQRNGKPRTQETWGKERTSGI